MESSSNRVLFEIKEVPENKPNVSYNLNNNIIYGIQPYTFYKKFKEEVTNKSTNKLSQRYTNSNSIVATQKKSKNKDLQTFQTNFSSFNKNSNFKKGKLLYNYNDNNNYNNTINNNGILSTLIDDSINTFQKTNECIHTEFNHKEYTSHKSDSNILNISLKFNEKYKTNRITPFVAQETNGNNSNSFLKTIKSKKLINNNKVKTSSCENNGINHKDNFYRILYLRKGKNMTKIFHKKNNKLPSTNNTKNESKKKDIFNKKINNKINVKKIIINRKNKKNKIFNKKQIQSKENINNNKSNVITKNDLKQSCNHKRNISLSDYLLSKKYLTAQNKFKDNYFATIIQKMYKGFIFRKKLNLKNKNKLNKSQNNPIISYAKKNKSTNKNSQYKHVRNKSLYVKKKISDKNCNYNKIIKDDFPISKFIKKKKVIEELKIDFKCPNKIKEIKIDMDGQNLGKISNQTQMNFSFTERKINKYYQKYNLQDVSHLWSDIMNKNIILHQIKINKLKNKKRLLESNHINNDKSNDEIKSVNINK